MALWFASRGKGNLSFAFCWPSINFFSFLNVGLIDTTEYTSHARVLISGLGADEQLGGYSRHREAYKRGSWKELIKEVSFIRSAVVVMLTPIYHIRP